MRHALRDRPAHHAILTSFPQSSIRLREIYKLTQREASAKLGIAQSTLSRIEQGRLENVTWRVLAKFCTLFDVTPNHLLGYSTLPNPAGNCAKCGVFLGGKAESPGHTTRECIMSMDGQGRRPGYIAHEFDLTVRSIEFIVNEEYRIRAARLSHAVGTAT